MILIASTEEKKFVESLKVLQGEKVIFVNHDVYLKLKNYNIPLNDILADDETDMKGQRAIILNTGRLVLEVGMLPVIEPGKYAIIDEPTTGQLRKIYGLTLTGSITSYIVTNELTPIGVDNEERDIDLD